MGGIAQVAALVCLCWPGSSDTGGGSLLIFDLTLATVIIIQAINHFFRSATFLQANRSIYPAGVGS